jgi:uncharacterized protein YndB with AHSA1/START domain
MYTVIAQREIPAPPERIWAFLTDPALLGKWFADARSFGPGEDFRFEFGDGDYHGGRVVEWEPEISLGMVWTFLDLGPEYEVRYSMLRRKRGTELSVQDRGALTQEEAECLRVGWHEFLVRLERSAQREQNTRFKWRKLISFTARIGDRAGARESLADPAWYEGTFPGVSAEVLGAAGDDLSVRIVDPAWGAAATHLRADFRRIGGQDYLYGYHSGWGELPGSSALHERRRFVELWRDGLLALGAR